MNTNNIKLAGFSEFNIFDGKIRCLNVDYYCEEQKDLLTKILYCINDAEIVIGYKQHGWSWFRDYKRAIRAFGSKYTDGNEFLLALNNVFLRKKANKVLDRKAIDKLKADVESISINEFTKNIISLEDTGKLLETSNKNRLVKVERPTHTCVSKDNNKTENEALTKSEEMNAAKEANGNQVGELLEVVHPGNDMADAFNNVFDSAKEITRYGELVREEIQLTNEMSEMRVKIADFTQKLKAKELAFKQNQRDILEMKKTLKNNPLLKLEETTKQVDNSDELKKKVERLEAENQSIKAENQSIKAENQSLKEEKQDLEDRLGEGENFKTASMFPNKRQYFFGDDKEVNGKIGLSLSKMASSKGIHIDKVRSGTYNVGNFPVWLHQKLEEFIVNKVRNEFTSILNPVLKAEYRV